MSDPHAPLAVESFAEFPDWAFIKCSCGENPISNVWLNDHWTGDPEAGKQAVAEVIGQQAANQRTRDGATNE